MKENIKIGFIGAGTMGKAIIKGLINSKFLPKENIMASEVLDTTAKQVSEELNIAVTLDNKEVVKNSDIIILCVKPFNIKKVLEEVRNKLSKEKMIVSIAAGINTESIEDTINKEIPVIRVMPNTPAVVGEGMTAICKGKYTNNEQMEYIKELFSNIGRCIEIQEKYINAVT